MTPVREYPYNSFQLFMYFVVGIGAVGAFFYLTRNHLYGASYALFVPLAMALMHLDFKPIKLFKGHLEFKTTPARSATIIEYIDIIEVKRDSEIKLSVSLKNESIKIPIKFINPDDRDDLETFLRRKVEVV